MFETVIVPLDGSELAEKALGVAQAIKEKFGSKLILIRSVESLTTRLAQMPGGIDTIGAATEVELLEQAVEAEQKDAQSYLEAQRTKLGGEVEVVLLEGGAADAIVSLSKERGAGLVVMSSHGRGGLGRLVHGSVADSVLRHGTVPVLLVRATEGG